MNESSLNFLSFSAISSACSAASSLSCILSSAVRSITGTSSESSVPSGRAETPGIKYVYWPGMKPSSFGTTSGGGGAPAKIMGVMEFPVNCALPTTRSPGFLLARGLLSSSRTPSLSAGSGTFSPFTSLAILTTVSGCIAVTSLSFMFSPCAASISSISSVFSSGSSPRKGWYISGTLVPFSSIPSIFCMILSRTAGRALASISFSISSRNLSDILNDPGRCAPSSRYTAISSRVSVIFSSVIFSPSFLLFKRAAFMAFKAFSLSAGSIGFSSGRIVMPKNGFSVSLSSRAANTLSRAILKTLFLRAGLNMCGRDSSFSLSSRILPATLLCSSRWKRSISSAASLYPAISASIRPACLAALRAFSFFSFSFIPSGRSNSPIAASSSSAFISASRPAIVFLRLSSSLSRPANSSASAVSPWTSTTISCPSELNHTLEVSISVIFLFITAFSSSVAASTKSLLYIESTLFFSASAFATAILPTCTLGNSSFPS